MNDGISNTIYWKIFIRSDDLVAKVSVYDVESHELCSKTHYEGNMVGKYIESSFYDRNTTPLWLLLGAPSIKEKKRQKEVSISWFVVKFYKIEKINHYI